MIQIIGKAVQEQKYKVVEYASIGGMDKRIERSGEVGYDEALRVKKSIELMQMMAGMCGRVSIEVITEN